MKGLLVCLFCAMTIGLFVGILSKVTETFGLTDALLISIVYMLILILSYIVDLIEIIKRR